MATSFNNVKTNIPGVGWRAYLFAQYRMVGGLCTPNPNNVARQCMYLDGAGSALDTWGPGRPFDGLFPNVGEFISADVVQYTQCYKVLEIIDEATFMSGTCVSCYNNGFQGNCSDVYITTPPYPGDPNGCRYNNSINNQGIVKASFLPGSVASSYIQSDCQNCTQGLPPVFEPNMAVNCCDPTETYQLSPVVLNTITGTGVNQIGVNDLTEAFRADLYIGGASSGYKCFHLKEDYPPFGPMAYTINFDAFGKRNNCTLLNDHIVNNTKLPPCCGTPPPQYEWCCMTGVAGPAGPSTCTQVLVGQCQMGMANVSAGPFTTQQDCINHPCSVIPPAFTPNIVINCCDPTEKYQVGGIDLIRMTGTPNLISPIPLGVVNYTEAFIGNFLNQPANPTNGPYPNETGTKCWHLGEENPTSAPQANNMSFNPGLAYGPIQKYTSCGDIPPTLIECCPIGCEPPFAKLAKLTSTLDKFTSWKTKSLGGDGIITGGGKSGNVKTTRSGTSQGGSSSGGGGY